MLSFALTLLLTAAAPEAAAEPAPTTTAAKPVKPKKICRGEANTGSRLAKKVCRTQEEWDNQADSARDDVRLRGAN